MTISEYELRLKAYRLKRLDEQEFIYQQAWANWQVQSTKQQGKKQVPVYSTFKKFFDKEKFENDILGIDSPNNTFKKDNKLIDLMKKANN
ncbi:hypothetical protein IL308_10025 [Lactococcus lactis]|uniref:Uncharacterized protein n=1 Tax=Lactococcus lactis subsp. lactis TaxID=1360 RepID=A0A0V8DX45_LACLL|nr:MULTISPECIES: hypothetical protein [Lactococcus]KSU18100.1 conserved hypothetical protein - phage associated [Lactococcus lactis subsp. lactis]MBK5077094.1 hypothetical protein [Lactococcus lactis]MCA2388859.1 hypothetical protein [Lactococcus sp. NH2-7C]WGV30417.1 hypothetical protein QJV49_00075 [Lactococcus sp. NH2-7C]